MEDITVDTNVFVHAGNPGTPRFEPASRFVDELRICNTALCHDPGPIYPPDECRSLAFAEYWQQVGPANPIRAVITELVLANRLKPVSTSLRSEHRRWIANNVPTKRDRTFLQVAANSETRVFVTHDESDFTPRVRREVGRRLHVILEDAAGATTRLREQRENEAFQKVLDVT